MRTRGPGFGVGAVVGPRNPEAIQEGRPVEAQDVTFTDGAGTTLTVSGGTMTYHALPGFDLAPREYEVPRTFTVTLDEVSWPVEPVAPRGMNRAQRRRKGRVGA